MQFAFNWRVNINEKIVPGNDSNVLNLVEKLNWPTRFCNKNYNDILFAEIAEIEGIVEFFNTMEGNIWELRANDVSDIMNRYIKYFSQKKEKKL